jgi:hypothetical protein
MDNSNIEDISNVTNNKRISKPTDKLLVSVAECSSPEERAQKSAAGKCDQLLLKEELVGYFYRATVNDLNKDDSANIQVCYFFLI